jgi:hypothetical protein
LRHSWWFISSWCSNQKRICIPNYSHACYTPCLSLPPWLQQSSYICGGTQLMLIIMLFSSTSYYFIPLHLNILLSTLFSIILNVYSYFNVTKLGAKLRFCIFNFYIVRRKTRRQMFLNSIVASIGK